MRVLYFMAFFLIATPLLAQKESKINYIADLYQYMRNKIERSEYYLNEYKVNSGSLEWSDLGNFIRTEKYYYSYTGDSKPALRLIKIITKVDDKRYYTEYMYDTA